jgi:hypothetical protein
MFWLYGLQMGLIILAQGDILTGMSQEMVTGEYLFVNIYMTGVEQLNIVGMIQIKFLAV